MEKPSIEKVIETLKKVEAERWAVIGNDFDAKNPSYKPEFRLAISGINFSVRICDDTPDTLIIHTCYSLLIKDWDKETRIRYENRKDRTEQKLLKDFYEYLSTTLRKREEGTQAKKEKEFEQILNKLLSD